MQSIHQKNFTKIYEPNLITKILVICTFYLSSFALYGATVLSANVFDLPNSEYTHIIIETNQAVSHSMMILKNPDRVVLDLQNTVINKPLVMLSKKDFVDDLSIKQVRLGNFKAGITRIVFDLKTEVKAVLNNDKPKDNYQHRLMLDLRPLNAEQKKPNPSNEVLRNSESQSTGAKIILEPPSQDEEMLLDEYEQY